MGTKKRMPLEEEVRLLSRISILEPLSEEDLRELLRRAPNIHLAGGEIFYGPEEASQTLFILEKGRVRIYKVADGRELTLAVVDAGTVFGEMAFTAQRLQGAYAQAMEPSLLIRITRTDLERLILKKPQVGIRIVRLLSERLRSYETRMEDITLKEVPARLASLILLLCESEGVMVPRREVKISHQYTHQHLGTMVGSNREAVTRAFTKLQDEGILELRHRFVYVKDIEELKRAAGHHLPQGV